MFILCNDHFWWKVKKGRTLYNFVRLQKGLLYYDCLCGFKIYFLTEF